MNEAELRIHLTEIDHAGHAPLTAPFKTVGCFLRRQHVPVPLSSELHHEFPLYLQARVWADVDPTHPQTAHWKITRPLCPTEHSDVHTVLEALQRGETGDTLHATPGVRKLAARALQLFHDAQAGKVLV